MYIKSLLLSLVLLLPGTGVYGIGELYASFLIVYSVLVIFFRNKFSILLVVFFAICSFLQLGYTLYSGKIIDDFYWIAYFSANPNEAKSFFEVLSLTEMFFYVGYLILLFGVIYFGYFNSKFDGKYSRPLSFDRAVIGFSLASLLLTVSFGGGRQKIKKISEIYPVNTVTSFLAAANITKGITSPMPKVYFLHEGSADVVLLILGESATKTRMSLYGYARDTTPKLKARKDLVVFDDALATGLNTQPNVKTLFTGKILSGSDMVDRDIFRLAKMAGYTVYYLDNNKYQNKDPIYLISSQSDVYVSINKIGETSKESDDKISPDEVLTQPYANILKKSDRKKLIIMHMAGSHPSQAKRYPEGFSKFSSYYDNSILYSDYLVDLWIEMLKSASGEKSSSVAMYVSDHGVRLPPGCGFGNVPNIEEINYGADDRYYTNQAVPLVLWLSNNFIKRNENYYKSVVLNKSKQVDHRFMYATVAHLFGAQIDDAAYSLFNEKMSFGVRRNTAGSDMDELIKNGSICRSVH